MVATQITIVIDRQNRSIIKVGSSVCAIPQLSQRDAVAILIQIADPPANSIPGQPTILTSADISAGKPRVTVSKKATGTSGDENTWLLAKLRESDFTWDANQSGFTGVLNLNTVQLQSFIGADESVGAQFEVRFSAGGSLSTLLPGPRNKFTIWANDDEGTDAPVDILNGVPTFTLPLQAHDAATGEVYVLSRTGPGGLSFDQGSLAGVPTFNLPIQFRDPTSGELYVLSRTAPGTLTFDLVQ